MFYNLYTVFTMYIVQLLYNFVHCDLPYVHMERRSLDVGLLRGYTSYR